MKSGVVNEASQVDRIQHNLEMTINFPLPCLQRSLPPSRPLYPFLCLSRSLSNQHHPFKGKPAEAQFNKNIPLITQLQNLKSYHPLSGFIEGNEKFPFKGNNYSWFFRGHVAAVFTEDNYYAEQLLYSNNW